MMTGVVSLSVKKLVTTAIGNVCAAAAAAGKVHTGKRKRCESMPIVPKYGPVNAIASEWSAYSDVLQRTWREHGTWNIPGLIGVFGTMDQKRTAKVPKMDFADAICALGMQNTRIVNVKEPWATALVRGEKNIENRGYAFPNARNYKGANGLVQYSKEYAIIVASKAGTATLKGFDDALADFKRRATWNHAETESTIPMNRSWYMQNTSQCIVGMVALTNIDNNAETCNPNRQSIWNNGDAFAWSISEAISFETPIPYGTGSQTLVYLNHQKMDTNMQFQPRNHDLKLAITSQLHKSR